MSDLLTTAQAAERLGWSYDYTRKLLKYFHPTPADTVGRNNLYTADQIEQLRR